MKGKLSSIVICILLLIVILCCYFSYTMYIKNTTLTNDNKELTEKVDALSKDDSNNKPLENIQVKENLSYEEYVNLYKTAVLDEINLIQGMTYMVPFNSSTQDIKDLAELTVYQTSTNKIYTPSGEPFTTYAPVSDVKEAIKEVFCMDVTIPDDMIKDNKAVVGIVSGFGIATADLINVKSLENNDYLITFNYDSSEPTTYNLLVNYTNGKVIYKELTK